MNLHQPVAFELIAVAHLAGLSDGGGPFLSGDAQLLCLTFERRCFKKKHVGVFSPGKLKPNFHQNLLNTKHRGLVSQYHEGRQVFVSQPSESLAFRCLICRPPAY